MKISRHQIIAFATVAREGGFSKAARRLNIGQSAITQHIAAFEEAIGSQLFFRSRTGVQLTFVGRELFSLADQIHVLEEQLFEKAHQYINLKEGHISLCISTSRPAMSIIAAFKKQFPGINIDLTVAPWRDALKLVQIRKVDVAIAIKPKEKTSTLYCQDIEERSFMAILPSQHPLSRCKELTLYDLLAETIILSCESSYTRFCTDKLFKQLGVAPNNILTTNTYEMMFEAVAHGLGIAIALEHASTTYQATVAIPIKELSEKHTYSVFCLKNKASLRIIHNFMDVTASLVG
jgi:DNA-binding transcriptional LysR family regulator